MSYFFVLDTQIKAKSSVFVSNLLFHFLCMQPCLSLDYCGSSINMLSGFSSTGGEDG